jgi:hypothetical protein
MTLQSDTLGRTRSSLKRIRTAAVEASEAPRARAAELGESLRQAALTSRDRSSEGVKTVVAQARQRPVSAGLLVLGAVVGGALLLNPAARRLAIAGAPRLWKAFKARTSTHA